MNRYCFLDMDGVLADFPAAICKAHNRPDPYLDPANHGKFEMDKIWDMSLHEFWEPTHQPGFWENFAKMPGADELVEHCLGYFGRQYVAILTAPANGANCVPEKRLWIRQHYPELEKSMIFSSAKHFLAGPKRVLIDDRDENVLKFQQAGGLAVLVPQLWNDNYHMPPYSATLYVKTKLTQFGMAGLL